MARPETKSKNDAAINAQTKELDESRTLAEKQGAAPTGEEQPTGLARLRGTWMQQAVQQLGPFTFLIIVAVALTFMSPYFLTTQNVSALFVQMSVIAIIAVGQTMVIVTAGIDLSVSTVVGLSGVVATMLVVNQHFPIPLGILCGILVGGVVGLVNGMLITKLSLPPFIATLGTLSICGGVALILTNGQAVFGVPHAFNLLGGGSIGPIPAPIVIMACVAVVGYFILAHTTLGRSAYAIGSNPETARLSGINIDGSLIAIYTISGLLAGLGGVIVASRIITGQPTAGENYNLQAIAAAVIGGASLFGGEGGVVGALIGATLMELIANGSDLLNISLFWQQVIIGVVILLAVMYDQVRRRAFKM